MKSSNNIFVASRMKHIVERKAVIDIIHTIGHSPVFIEAEQMRTGSDSIPLMNDMIDRSSLFIAVICEELGPDDENLELPPLVYEIKRFRNKVLKQSDQENKTIKGLIFMQENFNGKLLLEPKCRTSLKLALSDGEKYFKKVRFRDYDDLAVKVYNIVTKLWGVPEKHLDNATHKISISWAGKNKSGLLGTVASLLFTEYGLNINRVSASTVDNNAAIAISASMWFDSSLPKLDDIKSEIKKEVGGALGTDVTFNHEKPIINIERMKSEKPRFYFELKVLDIPGVLNALCKVFDDQNMDIEDIRQKPLASESKNQSMIIFTLTQIKPNRAKAYTAFIQLESRLRNFVGVRAINSLFTGLPKAKNLTTSL